MATSPFSQLAGVGESSKQEFKAGEVVIRDNTFAIGNAFYPIRNFSGVDVVALVDNRPPPVQWFLLGVFGLILLIPDFSAIRVLGLVLLIIGALVVINHYSSTRHDYALRIFTNSGRQVHIVSPDLEFLKKIAAFVYQAVEGDVRGAITFNVNNRSFTNNTNVSDSVINSGTVLGNIANTVRDNPAPAAP